jgi:hypothetical protein
MPEARLDKQKTSRWVNYIREEKVLAKDLEILRRKEKIVKGQRGS